MTESQGLSSNGRDYESAFHSAREEVRRFLIDAPGIIRAQTRYLAGAEGNIRACSVLACAEREDGSIDAGSITAAAAVELLHLATLVHDDIIDGAESAGVSDPAQEIRRKPPCCAGIICSAWHPRSPRASNRPCLAAGST